MNCQFVADAADPNLKHCPRCGLTIRTADPPERCYAKCRNPPPTKPGLGDYLASGLKAIGIHKKKRCGCGKRQAALNRVGKWLGF